MTERLSDRLRALASPVWEAQHQHPFVRGIGDGTLDLEKFKHWVRQDYRFLIEYCRLFGFAVGRAPDLAAMTRFADLLQATIRTEMNLHRSYAAEFGITEEELEAEPMSPTCRAYTDFLLRVATTGDFQDLVAALLPCMWGFSEIGQRLAAGEQPQDTRFAAWIAMYADPEFAQLAAWCRDFLDHVAGTVDDGEFDRLADAFVTSSRYELAFWEMAWTLERWSV